MEKIIVYTDGGSRGNPGPAGSGAYITNASGEELRSVSRFLGIATNNFAEYDAVILGLQEVKKIIGKKTRETNVEIRMDSELVKRQLSGEYQIKEESLFPLFIKIWNMRVKDFPNISFTHIRRDKNKKADLLANKAMDQAR